MIYYVFNLDLRLRLLIRSKVDCNLLNYGYTYSLLLQVSQNLNLLTDILLDQMQVIMHSRIHASKHHQNVLIIHKS